METQGPTPAEVAKAVKQFQEELNRNADALGRAIGGKDMKTQRWNKCATVCRDIPSIVWGGIPSYVEPSDGTHVARILCCPGTQWGIRREC